MDAAAVAYLHSASDGSSVGTLIFKDKDTAEVKKVEAFGKSFVSWDNWLCFHSFSANEGQGLNGDEYM